MHAGSSSKGSTSPGLHGHHTTQVLSRLQAPMPRWRAPVGCNSDSAAHAFIPPSLPLLFPSLPARSSVDRFNAVVSYSRGVSPWD